MAFPGPQAQAEALDRMLTASGAKLTGDRDGGRRKALTERIVGRFSCAK